MKIVAPKRLAPTQRKILQFLDAHDSLNGGAIMVTGHRTTDCYMGTLKSDHVTPVPVVQTNSITMWKLIEYGWVQRIVGSDRYRISKLGLAMLFPQKPC